ncbi:Neurobeachin-like protein 1 [Linderina pennispora]|nr:Neurobeachin-like protein 1 [Linderina pennispora]
MNPELGHTSMAAYSNSSGFTGQSGKWTLMHVLLAHDASVLDVAVSTDHGIVAGASADGTVVIWTLRSGQYLRSLMPCVDPTIGDAIPQISDRARGMRVERVLITAAAHILCYSVRGSGDKLDPDRAVFGSEEGGEAALHVYNVNGRHMRTRKLAHRLHDIAVTRDGMFGAVVSSDARVAVFDVHTLGIVRQFELPACGCSVAWSGATEQQIIVGCEGGTIVVISADLSYIH